MGNRIVKNNVIYIPYDIALIYILTLSAQTINNYVVQRILRQTLLSKTVHGSGKP